MTKFSFLVALFWSLSVNASVNVSGNASGDFPRTPDESLTPGSLCQDPDSYRYPEQIPYCRRNVESSRKWKIMETYDSTFGYHIVAMARADRSQFKIDHYLPLCMGGSNENTNLWPQHISVGQYTDPLEQSLCDRMAAGQIKQADAVVLMKRAKAHPEETQKILEELIVDGIQGPLVSEVYELKLNFSQAFFRRASIGSR